MTPADNFPDFASPQPRPLTPPTTPVSLPTEPRPTRWPTVIAVIGIIWSVLGISCSLWGTADEFFRQPSTATQPAAGLAGGGTMRFVAALDYLVNVGLCIVLLIAGVGLLRRRPWSARFARLWAVLDLILMVVGTLVLYDYYKRQFVVSIADSGLSMGTVGILYATLTFFGLLVSFVFPVFVLIWFARRKIKDEVATWKASTV